jgi:proteasome beta subunit
MTIVIALSCSDGVVMASDSQASDPNSGVRFDTQKVFPLTDRAVWGGSGESQTITYIDRVLQAYRSQIEASADLVADLPLMIKPVLAQRYANFIQAPNTQLTTPATTTLACGYDSARGGWIIEVDHNCISCDYGSRGFHAVGSAAGFANIGNALLAHFRPAHRPLSQGKLIAYRVIDAAIQTAMQGVGGDIQMWYVDAKGVQQADPDEISEIRGFVGAWQEEEAELLSALAGTGEGEPVPLPAPSSENINEDATGESS